MHTVYSVYTSACHTIFAYCILWPVYIVVVKVSSNFSFKKCQLQRTRVYGLVFRRLRCPVRVWTGLWLSILSEYIV